MTQLRPHLRARVENAVVGRGQARHHRSGEEAGENASEHASDGVDAKCVEGIVIAKVVLWRWGWFVLGVG
jgi:hypothetical protein